jgi:Flp pilus assembly protein TadD
VTRDLEKAKEVYGLWAQTYPRDSGPINNLGVVYQTLGQYEKSLQDFRATQRMSPNDAIGYANTLGVLVSLNRVKEARAMAAEAAAKKIDSSGIRFDLYQLAFLQ